MMINDCHVLSIDIPEKHKDGLQRSLSVPPRKRRDHKGVMVQLRNRNLQEDICEENPLLMTPAESTISRNMFGSISVKSYKTSRKRGIRVSKFNPIGIDLPQDVIQKIRDVEEKSLVDVLKANSISNGKLSQQHVTCSADEETVMTKHKKSKRKTQGNVNGLVKILQGGVRRITNLSSKQITPHGVIKIVEIVRSSEEILGIFITKRKLLIAVDMATQSLCDTQEDYNCKQGVFISRLAPNCFAAKNGLVQTGDQILAVNTIQVSALDVKTVATMMCMLNRLILTVRTQSTNNIKSSFHATSDMNYSDTTNKSSMLTVSQNHKNNNNLFAGMPPKDENFDKVVPIAQDASVICHKNATSSAQLQPHENVLPVIQKNVIHPVTSESIQAPNENFFQSKFDESFQILLDAIAFCDNHKNSNNNSIATNVYNYNETTSSTANSVHATSCEQTQGNVNEAEKANCLLTEILNTVESRKDSRREWKMHSIPELKQSTSLNFSKDANYLEKTSTDAGVILPVHHVAETHLENDYDNLCMYSDESLPMSESSSIQEVNLDEYYNTMWCSAETNNNLTLYPQEKFTSQSLSGSSSSSLVNTTAHTKVFPESSKSFPCLNSLDNGTSASLGIPVESQTNYWNAGTAEETCGSENILCFREGNKFPVTSDDTAVEAPDTTRITVDKKRKWLNAGPAVSDELQKRLEGVSSHDPVISSTLSNDVDDTLENCNKNNENTKSSSNLKYSQPQVRLNGGSTLLHSTSPAIPRSLSNHSLGNAPTNEFCGEKPVIRRKASLRSPIEKSAKSFLSLMSSKSSAPLKDAGNFTNGSCSKSGESKSSSQVAISCGIQSENGDEISPEHIVSTRNDLKSVNKVASPSRLRKKNWSRKFTKKFKIMGSSSENAVSDYSCWGADEQHQGKEVVAPANNSRSISKEAFTIGDSAVLNRYHLDISMAHQRRLSRKLVLENAAKDPSQKLLTLSQFRKYKPLPMMNTKSLSPIEGCLVLTLYGVRELKKNLCEAYCLVQVDNEDTKRIGTTMQTCRSATTWNQCFEMIVNEAINLHLTVYTWDTRGGKHKIYASATLNLPTLIQGTNSCYRYSERLAVSLEPRGTLYVKIALERNPSSPGPFLFGADLQSISERENSGHLVPNLVRLCIEEVEKRGMQVVGIYRLCGSAIVKKNLRRKLEENHGDFDLTATNFPDVNVITGILKDFLRELPQPLFPPELLEAVTVAMEKNPGPVSATVVKEPFSPDPLVTPRESTVNISNSENNKKARTDALLLHVKQIPSSLVERATLYALMNHLKKVSLFSDKNKMICQNLAVCFGPVLLGPVNSGQANGMDLHAAIGFKRHIQVLNYMISNWPDSAVEVQHITPPVDKRISALNGDGSKKMNRVSLTRRLSRVYIVDDLGVPREEESHPGIMSFNQEENASGPVASLMLIPETFGTFSDPDIDMYQVKSRHGRVFTESSADHS